MQYLWYYLLKNLHFLLVFHNLEAAIQFHICSPFCGHKPVACTLMLILLKTSYNF